MCNICYSYGTNGHLEIIHFSTWNCRNLGITVLIFILFEKVERLVTLYDRYNVDRWNQPSIAYEISKAKRQWYRGYCCFKKFRSWSDITHHRIWTVLGNNIITFEVIPSILTGVIVHSSQPDQHRLFPWYINLFSSTVMFNGLHGTIIRFAYEQYIFLIRHNCTVNLQKYKIWKIY